MDFKILLEKITPAEDFQTTYALFMENAKIIREGIHKENNFVLFYSLMFYSFYPQSLNDI